MEREGFTILMSVVGNVGGWVWDGELTGGGQEEGPTNDDLSRFYVWTMVVTRRTLGS